jgi:arylsulfatase A-like enzyme
MRGTSKLFHRIVAALALVATAAAQDVVRVGIVGADTSHAPAFAKLLNAKDATGDLALVEVTAAFPAPTDLHASRSRVAGFTAELRGLGIEIVDSMDALLERVDAVILASVDGRAHRRLVAPVLAARKPVFVDKPLAASLDDAVAIAALAEAHGTPWFSSSALRFGAALPEVGAVRGCDAWSPCPLEPTHGDLFWYGIHGVETLFAVLGPSCESVSMTRSGGTDLATGTWRDGRIGTFRGLRDGKTGYGAVVFGSERIAPRGDYPGYAPLVAEIAAFFRTGVPPVSPDETLEVLAFLAAAEASLARGGAPVALDEVLAHARRPEPPRRPNVVLCIADDWSFPHASAYGDPVVATPAFDRIAKAGILFTNAFCNTPSCTASRGALLSGQASHRLGPGANLHGHLPAGIPVYPELLAQAGYVVGHTGKGWGPGRTEPGGRNENPAGRRFASFDEFLATVPDSAPFCFWFGGHDPHRPYEPGSGAMAGLDAAAVRLPPFWPDTEDVRNDVLDYYAEVQRFDAAVGRVLDALRERGLERDTLVVVTSDHGMPFPRAKANVYDLGARVPLALCWPARLRGGHRTPAFVSLCDLAPTLLEAAGVARTEVMTGASLWPLVDSGDMAGRHAVFVERERHAHVRAGNLGYPVRAVRTERYLYVRNLAPDRWPAGDPELVFSVGPFGDVDDGPTKRAVLADRNSDAFRLAFARRPAEELYDLARDPWQIANVAIAAEHADALAELRRLLDGYCAATGDPRRQDGEAPFDSYPYYGAPAKGR